MFFVALATDFDGTLAEHGRVSPSTLEASRGSTGTGPADRRGSYERTRLVSSTSATPASTQGTLGEDKSFYFRGPEAAQNLRAQNLMIFLQLADGVDDATWLHHLKRGDYSRWFRRAIRDDGLTGEAEAVESAGSDPAAARAAIREMVTRRYMVPAER